MLDIIRKISFHFPTGDIHGKHMLMFVLFIPLLPLLAVSTLVDPELTIFYSIVLLIFMIVVVRPMWGLFACIVMLPLENVKLLWNTPFRTDTVEMISMFPIPALLTLVALILSRKTNLKGLFPSLILFFAYATFSLFYTQDIYHGLNEYSKLTGNLIMVLVFVSLITDKTKLKQVFTVIAIMSFFMFILEVSSQYVNGTEKIKLMQDVYLQFQLPYHSKRPSGFASPGVVGNFLGVYALINIALLPMYGSKVKGLLLVNVFLLSVGVVLTASKAALGTLIMGLFCLVFLAPRLRRHAIKWSAAIVAFLLLLLPVVYLLQQDVVMAKRISSAVTAGSSYLKERLTWWKIGFQSLIDSYFVGDGIGGYVKLIDPYPYAHSYYFSVIFDLGLIGFVIYMYILLRSLLVYVKSILLSRDGDVQFAAYCLFTAFLMTLVYGLVDEEYTYRLVFFFIAIGLSIRNIIMHAPAAEHPSE